MGSSINFNSKLRERNYIIEFIQHPGETVFVPGGWWHAVLNLDDTMAITQNFLSVGNFDRVWPDFRISRKKLAVEFFRKLKEKQFDIYKKAKELNESSSEIDSSDISSSSSSSSSSSPSDSDSSSSSYTQINSKKKKRSRSR